MNRKYIRRIFRCISVLLVMSMFSFSASASSIDDEKNKLGELENSYDETKQLIEELGQKQYDAIQVITELDNQIAQLNENINTVNEQIADKENEIQITQLNLENAKIDESNQYDAMKKRIQYMYENGETSYLDIVFSSESISEMLNQAEYFSSITSYDREMLTKLQETREYIAECEVTLTNEKTELEGTRAQLDELKSSVELALSAKSSELAQLNQETEEANQLAAAYEKEINAQQAYIEQMEEEQRKKEEEERRLRELAAANNQSNVASYTADHYDGGIFSWPIPASTRITSEYGVYESVRTGMHNGIDVGAPTGTEILAAYGGTVVISQYSATAGNYVMISHGDGVFTVYMHASKLLVSVGDKVTTGQCIALVGSTGNSTGPHLHFGVRVNGSYVNPWGYVSLP